MKLRSNNIGSSEKDIEEWKTILQYLDDLQKYWTITKTKNPNLKEFQIFSSKEKINHLETWIISKDKNSFRLCLLEYQLKFRNGRSISTEKHKYFFGYLHSNTDFGKTYIRPETLIDRVNEFFNPTEIEFPNHKEFNKKYFCLSNNKKLLLKNADKDLLNLISSISNFEIEFNTKKSLFKLPKAINKSELIKLCNIGIELSKII